MSHPDPTRPGTAPALALAFRRYGPVTVLALFAAVLALAGGRMMFGSFMIYDDEGYVLQSLRSFVEKGELYRTVYTQYGPLPYAFYSLLHAAGMPLVHSTGRLVTLLLWTMTALVPALLVWHWTRRTTVALATLAGIFLYLWLSVREPTHPGSLVALITALMAALGCRALAENKPAFWAIVAGAGTAALLLTKINTGVFAGIAIVACLLLFSTPPSLRSWTPWLVGAGLVLLPFLLMRSRLGSDWLRTLAILFSIGSIPLIGACARVGARNPLPISRRHLALAVLGGALVAAVTLGYVMPRGTSWSDLIEGTLLGPLRHPVHFSLIFPAPTALIASAAGSLLAFIVAWRVSASGATNVDRAIVTLRLVVAAMVTGTLVTFPTWDPHTTVFWWTMPWLWVLVWPLTGEPSSRTIGRGWLALLAFLQWLHAYPVPGTQMAWGTFLVLPLVALAGCEAVAWTLARRTHAGDGNPWSILVRASLLAAAVAMAVPMIQNGNGYRHARPLGLPGTELVRLPAATTATLQLLSRNASIHAGTLFSLPGMLSFNLWSGVRTPTHSNVTQWFLLFDQRRQEEIIATLEADPLACLIVDPIHLSFLKVEGLAPSGPLYDYLMRRFRLAFRVGQYEFWAREGRRVAPFFMAELLDRPSASGAADPHNTLLQVPLLLPDTATVAGLKITTLESPAPPLRLDSSSTRIELTSIATTGEIRSSPRPATLPTRLSGPTLLSVYFDRKDTRFYSDRSIISLLAPDGSEIAVIRLRL